MNLNLVCNNNSCELYEVKFVDCCNLWAHLHVGCMYALFRSKSQWLHQDVTRQNVVLLHFKCVLAWIASMVMVSTLKPVLPQLASEPKCIHQRV
jgi:hypothetical protein